MLKNPLAKKRKRMSPDTLLLSLELGASAGVVQHLLHRNNTEKPVERIKDREVDAKIEVSLREDDYVLHVEPKRLADNKATSVIRTGAGIIGKTFIINKSESGVIYGTPKSREDIKKHDVVPLALLADILFPNNQNSVVGFVLGKNEILILITYTEDGIRYQVDILPDNVERSVNVFAAREGLPEDFESKLFTSNDLFRALESSDPYPSEDTFYGVPYATGLQSLAGVSVLSAVMVVSWFLYETYEVNNIEAETTEVSRKLQITTGSIADKASMRIEAFSKKASVDTGRLFSQAESIWRPGDTLVSEINKSGVTHVVHTKITSIDVKQRVDDEVIKRVFKKLTVENCVQETPKLGANYDEIKSKHNCTVADSGLTSFGF